MRVEQNCIQYLRELTKYAFIPKHQRDCSGDKSFWCG